MQQETIVVDEDALAVANLVKLRQCPAAQLSLPSHSAQHHHCHETVATVEATVESMVMQDNSPHGADLHMKTIRLSAVKDLLGKNNRILVLNTNSRNKVNQSLNNNFYVFLKDHTVFLHKFVLDWNWMERVGGAALMKDTISPLLMQWITDPGGEATYFLEYHRKNNRLQQTRNPWFNVVLEVKTADAPSFMKEYWVLAQKILLQVKVLILSLAKRMSSEVFYNSRYTYGHGLIKFRAEFTIRRLTSSDWQAMEKFKAKDQYKSWSKFMLTTKARWSNLDFTRVPVTSRPDLENFIYNCDLDPNTSPHHPEGTEIVRLRQTTIAFPSAETGVARNNFIAPTPLTDVASIRLTRWKFFVGEGTNKAQLLEQYKKLEEVYDRLGSVHNLHPPRAFWEDVFTAKCPTQPCCWVCRECRKRFSQLTLVLVAAQGTKDSLCLPHFGAVFRHPRYSTFSVEEWSSMSWAELTMVFSFVSKQAQSACYVQWILGDLAYKSQLPRKVCHISQYLGFGKKTACLLLNAMDPQMRVGIAVDRHLATAFKSLGWSCAEEGNETQISYMVEAWLPPEHWSRCNLVCAGLRQLAQGGLAAPSTLLLKASAKFFGPNHVSLVEKCCGLEPTSSNTTNGSLSMD